jgi:hypothetical protein
MALTTTQKLDEARTALHTLLIGGKRVSIRYEGRSVEYSSANIQELRTYIRQLERELEIEQGVTTTSRRPFEVAW